jgi:UDP-N-acetylglucosamine 1-carboxyvinyltransferase
MAGGDVTLRGARADTLEDVILTMRRAGIDVSTNNEGMRIKRNGSGIMAVDVTTDPYPGFPTDLQAQFMGLMTMAKGKSHIRETIFENRFMHVQELARLGADIHLHGDMAEVRGVAKLTGADVMATDLRASVSLVIAGLAAQGDTMLHRVYHLDRGFESLEEKLQGVGADVERLSGS